MKNVSICQTQVDTSYSDEAFTAGISAHLERSVFSVYFGKLYNKPHQGL